MAESVFVLFDFSLDELAGDLTDLRQELSRKVRLEIPGLATGINQGRVFLDVVRESIDRADKVVAFVDRPNCNVAFEFGYAVGRGKPSILAARSGEIPPWLRAPPFNGYLVSLAQDKPAVRKVLLDTGQPPITSWKKGRGVLFLCPGGTAGAPYHLAVARRFDWTTLPENGWSWADLPRLVSGIGSVYWTILPIAGTDELPDGEENAAAAAVAGFALAQGVSVTVLRSRDHREVTDVADRQIRFSSHAEFEKHLIELNDGARQARPRKLLSTGLVVGGLFVAVATFVLRIIGCPSEDSTPHGPDGEVPNIPNVVGLPLDEARSKLQEAGFAVTIAPPDFGCQKVTAPNAVQVESQELAGKKSPTAAPVVSIGLWKSFALTTGEAIDFDFPPDRPDLRLALDSDRRRTSLVASDDVLLARIFLDPLDPPGIVEANIDGRIDSLDAGWFNPEGTLSGFGTSETTEEGRRRTAVLCFRLDPTGRLDPSFGTDGWSRGRVQSEVENARHYRSARFDAGGTLLLELESSDPHRNNTFGTQRNSYLCRLGPEDLPGPSFDLTNGYTLQSGEALVPTNRGELLVWNGKRGDLRRVETDGRSETDGKTVLRIDPEHIVGSVLQVLDIGERILVFSARTQTSQIRTVVNGKPTSTVVEPEGRIARYGRDGLLDRSFGVEGFVKLAGRSFFGHRLYATRSGSVFLLGREGQQLVLTSIREKGELSTGLRLGRPASALVGSPLVIPSGPSGELTICQTTRPTDGERATSIEVTRLTEAGRLPASPFHLGNRGTIRHPVAGAGGVVAGVALPDDRLLLGIDGMGWNCLLVQLRADRELDPAFGKRYSAEEIVTDWPEVTSVNSTPILSLLPGTSFVTRTTGGKIVVFRPTATQRTSRESWRLEFKRVIFSTQ